jgi:hypothetical protein
VGLRAGLDTEARGESFASVAEFNVCVHRNRTEMFVQHCFLDGCDSYSFDVTVHRSRLSNSRLAFCSRSLARKQGVSAIMTVSNCFGFDFPFLLAACSHRSLNSCPAVTGSVRWELVCATCLVHCKDRSCRVQVGRRAETGVRSKQPVLRSNVRRKRVIMKEVNC